MTKYTTIGLAVLAAIVLIALQGLNSYQAKQAARLQAEEVPAPSALRPRAVVQPSQAAATPPASALSATQSATPLPTPAPVQPPPQAAIDYTEVADAGLNHLETEMNQSSIQTFLNSVGLIYPPAIEAKDTGFSKESFNGQAIASMEFTTASDVEVHLYVSKAAKLDSLLKPLAQRLAEFGMRIDTPRPLAGDGTVNGVLASYSSADRKGYVYAFSNRGSRAHYVITIETDATSMVNLNNYIQTVRLNPQKANSAPF